MKLWHSIIEIRYRLFFSYFIFNLSYYYRIIKKET